MTEFFSFSNEWRSYLGYIHGMQQPSIIGTIYVNDIPSDRLNELFSFFAKMAPKAEMPKFVVDGSEDTFIYQLAFWVGELQRINKIPVSLRNHIEKVTSSKASSRCYQVTFPIHNKDSTILTLVWIKSVSDYIYNTSINNNSHLENQAEKLIKILQKYQPIGNNRYYIAQTAFLLNIPLSNFTEEILQLGTGCCRRYLSSTLSERTSALGVAMAGNKYVTARALKNVGLPGATNILVNSVSSARDAANKLGYPVVVKPADQEQGIGVAADLLTNSQVEAAFINAAKFSKQILVEKWEDGFTHRISVFNNEIIRVSKRIAGGVIGDGVHTVSELVNQIKDTRLNQHGYVVKVTSDVQVDAEAIEYLQQYGKTPSYTPADGEYVRLRRIDNINVGGRNDHIDIKKVHKDNVKLAMDITAMFGLDFSGIDLIIKDITKSWLHESAIVCEVNAIPQMGGGVPEAYTRMIKDFMGDEIRIPIHLHLCPMSEQDNLIKMLVNNTNTQAVSAKSGLWFGKTCASKEFSSGFSAAKAMLRRQDAEYVEIILDHEEIEKLGLPVDWVNQVSIYDLSETRSSTYNFSKVMSLIRPHTSPDAFARNFEDT